MSQIANGTELDRAQESHMGPYKLTIASMLNALFLVTIFELFVGGGGRFAAIGPITLRMLLFTICILSYTFVLLAYPQRVRNGQILAAKLVLLYLTVHFIAVTRGALAGYDIALIGGELQPSVYWLAAPFFALVLQSRQMLQKVAALVQVSSVFLAFFYLVLLTLMWSSFVEAAEVRKIAATSRELFFRGDSFFFYKGFLYLGLGVIFFLALKGFAWRLFSIMVLVALMLTLTRGLLLSLALSAILMLAFQYRWRELVGVSALAGLAVLLVFVYLPGLDEVTASQRLTAGAVDPSIATRMDDMRYVVDNMTFKTLFVGEGYGAEINSRHNVENTYLWAFWKLGVFGLLFWLVPIALSSIYYLSISRQYSRFDLATAYYFGTLFVYIQTATNPYLNNPIGLSFVIVSLFALRTLFRDSRSDESS